MGEPEPVEERTDLVTFEDDTSTADTAYYTDYTTNYDELPTDVDADCWSWAVEWQDGQVAGTTLRTYDDPTLLQTTLYERDYEPDGALDYRATYTYDDDRPTGYVYDYDADGSLDRIIEISYDPVTLLRTAYKIDDDGNGTWDEVWTYGYVNDLTSTAYVDDGDDGETDIWYTYYRDGEDRRTRIEGDRDNDGTIDILYSYTYLNPTGPDVISAFDEDNDGEPEYTTEYRYDINEDLIYSENHTGDEWSIYEYERNVDGDTTRQFGTVGRRSPTRNSGSGPAPQREHGGARSRPIPPTLTGLWPPCRNGERRDCCRSRPPPSLDPKPERRLLLGDVLEIAVRPEPIDVPVTTGLEL
jgi:hypothetical protein